MRSRMHDLEGLFLQSAAVSGRSSWRLWWLIAGVSLLAILFIGVRVAGGLP